MGLSQAIDVSAGQRKTILGLLKRYLPNTTSWVYGSRVKWTSRPQSDLDMVVFAAPEQERQVSSLREAFEESNLPFRVDLFVWDTVPEQFHEQIEADHVVLVEEEERGLPHNWSEQTLGELTNNFDSIRVPVKQADRRSGPYPYYGASGIVDHINDYLFDGEYLLIAEDGENLRTRNTPIAFLANGKFWVNNHAHIVRGNHKANTQFLMYALSGLDVSGYLTGSTMPKLTQGNLNRVSLQTPPLSEQRAIAHILGTLDDKIELNRQMNETLEEMARALFKSWFVDFLPVRAKMEGRWRRGESFPGLPADLYDLFPDRLVDSELGKIPEGWEVKRLGSFLETLETGYRPRGGVSGIVTGIPSIGAESIEGVGIFDFNKTKYVPLEFYNGLKRGVVEDGDVLIYKDGGRPGELKPAVTYTSQGFPFNVFCINEHVYRVRTKRFSQQLLYCYLTTSTAFWQMRELATGVAQPGLNRRAVESIAIPVPADNRVIIACQERISPLLDECNINSLVSRSLSQIRDTLLPKLVSGELQLEDAEEWGEAIT